MVGGKGVWRVGRECVGWEGSVEGGEGVCRVGRECGGWEGSVEGGKGVWMVGRECPFNRQEENIENGLEFNM